MLRPKCHPHRSSKQFPKTLLICMLTVPYLHFTKFRVCRGLSPNLATSRTLSSIKRFLCVLKPIWQESLRLFKYKCFCSRKPFILSDYFVRNSLQSEEKKMHAHSAMTTPEKASQAAFFVPASKCAGFISCGERKGCMTQCLSNNIIKSLHLFSITSNILSRTPISHNIKTTDRWRE